MTPTALTAWSRQQRSRSGARCRPVPLAGLRDRCSDPAAFPRRWAFCLTRQTSSPSAWSPFRVRGRTRAALATALAFAASRPHPRRCAAPIGSILATNPQVRQFDGGRRGRGSGGRVWAAGPDQLGRGAHSRRETPIGRRGCAVERRGGAGPRGPHRQVRQLAARDRCLLTYQHPSSSPPLPSVPLGIDPFFSPLLLCVLVLALCSGPCNGEGFLEQDLIDFLRHSEQR